MEPQTDCWGSINHWLLPCILGAMPYTVVRVAAGSKAWAQDCWRLRASEGLKSRLQPGRTRADTFIPKSSRSFWVFRQSKPAMTVAGLNFVNLATPFPQFRSFGFVHTCCILQRLGLMPEQTNPMGLLHEYANCILTQKEVIWPSPVAGYSTLHLSFQDVTTPIRFHALQTVQDLLKAESTLVQSECEMEVYWEGIKLPNWAFLQSRLYTLVCKPTPCPFVIDPVLVTVDFLGVTYALVVPSTFTCHMVVTKVGVGSYESLLDHSGCELEPTSLVHQGLSITIHLDQDLIAFSLALKFEGFGHTPGILRFTEPQLMTGFWNLDQQIKNSILSTWAGLAYPNLTIWLPSFGAAVFEFWPGTIEEELQTWLQVPSTSVFALIHEIWGWNLIHFATDDDELQITRFGPENAPDVVTSFLATRVIAVCRRSNIHERRFQTDTDVDGTMLTTLTLLDEALGLPGYVVNALTKVRAAQDPRTQDLDAATCSTTLPWTCSPSQLPIHERCKQLKPLAGLNAKFVSDFAKAWAGQEPLSISTAQIKVICMDRHQPSLTGVSLDLFSPVQSPLFLFLLADQHWTFVHCFVENSCLHVAHYDGLRGTSLAYLEPLVSTLKQAWKPNHISIRSSWIFPQTRLDSCGTIALAHFGYILGLVSLTQARVFEKCHQSIAVVAGLVAPTSRVGYGPEDQSIIAALEQILPGKGVDTTEVKNRAEAAIKIFGAAKIGQALEAKNPWSALKQLGNSRPRPFMWVTHAELQRHIQDRAQSKFGADLDIRKPRAQKAKQQSKAPIQLDPGSLVIPPGAFINNAGDMLPQLSIAEVQKDAQGIAFATFPDVKQFLVDARFISTEALAVFVIGPFPESMVNALPTHAIRVPAIYKGTQEAILVEARSVQLGDQAVFQKHDPQAPELAVFPTVVFRTHVFRDLWETDGDWKDLVAKPVRTLTQCFTMLNMCRTADCPGTQHCGKYHASLEEEGVESGIIDVWGIRWNKYDGSKQNPERAEVLTMYLRVPESSFTALHHSSGISGTFFEPRGTETPGPNDKYSVVWLPQMGLKDAMHLVRTDDTCLAVCRIGMKYGVRCLARLHKEVHESLLPAKPFIDCAVNHIYRVEPLPIGTQRISLVETLQRFGWKAKPLQPCKGSMGKAWNVGAETEPPSPFIGAKHGWISITKVRDQAVAPAQIDIIATAKTKQHMKSMVSTGASSGAQASSDPWEQSTDPWAEYNKNAPKPPVSVHVQSKLDDVETRLQERVASELSKQVKDQAIDPRFAAVESQIQALHDSQQKLQHWVTDGSSKIANLQQDQQVLHQALSATQAQIQEQGTTLGTVVQEVTACSAGLQHITKEVSGLKDGLHSSLEQYFSRQSSHIEALLEKKQRVAWLGRPGPSMGLRKVPGSAPWFPGLWILCRFFLAFFVCFARIGEASVPGPVSADSLFEDCSKPVWTLPDVPEFVLSIGNPSGISNKLDHLDLFPNGWHHIVESQASRRQQSVFQGYLRGLSSRQDRLLRSTLGHPAPLRSGSNHAGAWTGVMTFGDLPLKEVPMQWPSGEHVSGRVLVTMGVACGLEITTATVYCPPKGPTYPNAKQLSESLLTPITEQLVLGRQGARAIVGDFNCMPGSLTQMRIWRSHGWIEIQELFQEWHDIQPRPTCKHSTSPDQIWMSPELAVRINITLPFGHYGLTIPCSWLAFSSASPSSHPCNGACLAAFHGLSSTRIPGLMNPTSVLCSRLLCLWVATSHWNPKIAKQLSLRNRWLMHSMPGVNALKLLLLNTWALKRLRPITVSMVVVPWPNPVSGDEMPQFRNTAGRGKCRWPMDSWTGQPLDGSDNWEECNLTCMPSDLNVPRKTTCPGSHSGGASLTLRAFEMDFNNGGFPDLCAHRDHQAPFLGCRPTKKSLKWSLMISSKITGGMSIGSHPKGEQVVRTNFWKPPGVSLLLRRNQPKMPLIAWLTLALRRSRSLTLPGTLWAPPNLFPSRWSAIGLCRVNQPMLPDVPRAMQLSLTSSLPLVKNCHVKFWSMTHIRFILDSVSYGLLFGLGMPTHLPTVGMKSWTLLAQSFQKVQLTCPHWHWLTGIEPLPNSKHRQQLAHVDGRVQTCWISQTPKLKISWTFTAWWRSMRVGLSNGPLVLSTAWRNETTVKLPVTFDQSPWHRFSIESTQGSEQVKSWPVSLRLLPLTSVDLFRVNTRPTSGLLSASVLKLLASKTQKSSDGSPTLRNALTRWQDSPSLPSFFTWVSQLGSSLSGMLSFVPSLVTSLFMETPVLHTLVSQASQRGAPFHVVRWQQSMWFGMLGSFRRFLDHLSCRMLTTWKPSVSLLTIFAVVWTPCVPFVLPWMFGWMRRDSLFGLPLFHSFWTSWA